MTAAALGAEATAAVAAAAAAAAGAPSASAPEVERAAEAAAAAEALAELLQRDANRTCFDCDAPLSALPALRAKAPPPPGRDGAAAAEGGEEEEGEEEGEEARGGDEGDERASLWCCTSHGLLLCGACAAVHARMGEARSRVVPHDGSLALTDLDACFAGGNACFASYLAEEVGVPRHVWLALP